MAVLLESLSKECLDRAQIAVPAGESADDPSGAEAVARRLGGSVVVKAEIPAGKKHLSGGIKFAENPAVASECARALLGSEVAGWPVTSVYVEQQEDVVHEYYVSVQPDEQAQTWRVTLARDGGVTVEDQLASTAGTGSAAFTVDLPPHQGQELARQVGAEESDLLNLGDALAAIATMAKRIDASLVEINPLARLTDGRLVALGALISIDERARYRHQELFRRPQCLLGVDRVNRPLRDSERAVIALNEEFPDVGDIRYQRLEGDVALMMMGGGAGLLAMDELLAAGVHPANYFDMTAGDVTEKIKRATAILLRIPGARGLFIGGNISALAPVPVRVRGICDALMEDAVDTSEFPVVVRLAGHEEDVARRILQQVPGVRYYGSEVTLPEAIAAFVSLLPESR